jgi:hypothetical protein
VPVLRLELDLRAQLDDRAREIERLHTILSQTVRALPVPEPPPTEAPDPVTTQATDRPLPREAPAIKHDPGRQGWWPRLVARMRGA